MKEDKRIVRNYYEQIYFKKIENHSKMDKFLEIYNLPKLTQEETESLNKLITADEIEPVVKKILAHRNTGPGGITGERNKAFKDELTPILHRLFKKIQEDGRLQTLFMKPASS